MSRATQMELWRSVDLHVDEVADFFRAVSKAKTDRDAKLVIEQLADQTAKDAIGLERAANAFVKALGLDTDAAGTHDTLLSGAASMRIWLDLVASAVQQDQTPVMECQGTASVKLGHCDAIKDAAASCSLQGGLLDGSDGDETDESDESAGCSDLFDE